MQSYRLPNDKLPRVSWGPPSMCHQDQPGNVAGKGATQDKFKHRAANSKWKRVFILACELRKDSRQLQGPPEAEGRMTQNEF